jgi:hypothetical protein
MRMLARNGSQYWLLRILSYVDKRDSNNNFTGEKVPVFADPFKFTMNTMPVDGMIESAVQGFIGRYDLIGICQFALNENDMLLRVGFNPTIELDWENGVYNPNVMATIPKIYDYKVGQALVSLNVKRYGLKARG